MREMTHPDGGFYSSLDADSEGEEGKFYLWSPKEIREVLTNKSDSELIIYAYNVTDGGNFEGSNVLQRTVSLSQLSDKFGITTSELAPYLNDLNKQLLFARNKRVRPGLDDKVLVSWNSLVLVAFAEAGRFLGRGDYVDMAIRNANFLTSELLLENNLTRSWRNGQAHHSAYLEDYAGLIMGLLSLYQSDPSPRWFETATQLTQDMLYHFNDPEFGFFDTRDDHEPLLFRPKDLQDNATPSGNSLAALALLQMAAYTGRGEWRDKAETSLLHMLDQVSMHPTAYSNWLCAIDFATANVAEVAIIGAENDPLTIALIEVLWSEFRPHMIFAQTDLPIDPNTPPLLANRDLINNQPTAYVCKNHICTNPVNSPQELGNLLKTP
jgi:hypothetical protein